MGSVLDTDQQPAETCVETVETTATQSVNLSADHSPIPSLQQRNSNEQTVLAPFSQIRTEKENFLAAKYKPEGGRQ